LVVVNEETGEAIEQVAPVVQIDDVDGDEESEDMVDDVVGSPEDRGVIRALPVDGVMVGDDSVPSTGADFSADGAAMPALPVEEEEVMDENVETQ